MQPRPPPSGSNCISRGVSVGPGMRICVARTASTYFTISWDGAGWTNPLDLPLGAVIARRNSVLNSFGTDPLLDSQGEGSMSGGAAQLFLG